MIAKHISAPDSGPIVDVIVRSESPDFGEKEEEEGTDRAETVFRSQDTTPMAFDTGSTRLLDLEPTDSCSIQKRIEMRRICTTIQLRTMLP